MWLYTDKGHISVVVHDRAPNKVLLRSRSQGTLPLLVSNGEERQSYTPNRDYYYRIITSKTEFKQILNKYIDLMAYTNFKDHIAKPDSVLSDEHVKAYHDVYWAGGRTVDKHPNKKAYEDGYEEGYSIGNADNFWNKE
tara:strand:- start:1515 stop:1928 length:414 start_codon:yes stop_codon:yes gene_type:complete